MLFCRGAVGAALGGLLPASFAIVGDMYPPEERPHAIAMMAVAWPLFQFVSPSTIQCIVDSSM